LPVITGSSQMRMQRRGRYGGKQHILGSFDTKQEAALAYDRRQGGKGVRGGEATELREHQGSGGGSSRSAGGGVRRRVGCRLVAAEATASTGLLAVVAVAVGAGGATSAVVVALVAVAVVVAAVAAAVVSVAVVVAAVGASVVAAVAVAVAAAVAAVVVVVVSYHGALTENILHGGRTAGCSWPACSAMTHPRAGACYLRLRL
jgi:hypothetical protein